MIDLTNGRPGTYTTNLTYIVSAERVPVDLSLLTANYTAESGDILTGKAPENVGVTIAGDAIVTLLNVDITSISDDWYEGEEPLHPYAGITCAGNVTLILSGDNKVKGGYQNYPGIHVVSNDEHPNSTLTIKGTGKLTASSNGYGAGIGGGYYIGDFGNIIIESGIIEAIGGSQSAGIGSGEAGNGGYIIINGGTITATGGNSGASLGTGIGTLWAHLGDITINGGTVTATGYSSPGIGSRSAQCGNILITGGTITATGGEYAAGIGTGDGKCGTITITDGVTRVTATKGSNSPNSIGAGSNGSCAGVTIEDTVYWDGTNYQNGGDTILTADTYTYQP